jgi:uncharacterized protein with LGFP repeats
MLPNSVIMKIRRPSPPPHIIPQFIIDQFDTLYNEILNNYNYDLGYPSEIRPINNRYFQGYFIIYQNGAIYLNENGNDYYLVWGEIFNKWQTSIYLGNPLSNVEPVNEILSFQTFANGTIYQTEEKEPIIVDRKTYDNWTAYGGEQQLGYPISDKLQLSNNKSGGWYQEFEKATLYSENNMRGAFPIYKQTHEKSEYKKISEKWHQLDGITGLLGFPVSNVKATVDKSNVRGFFQEFNKGIQDGAIYYVNGSTYEVHGGIYAQWKKIGAEKSLLGYPISDEFSISKVKDGKQSNFTNGILYWNPTNNEVLATYTNNKEISNTEAS